MTTRNASRTTMPGVVAALCLLIGSNTPSEAARLAPNAVPIRLGMAPDGVNQNRILVTVRVCAHGTSTCADVPDVLIDTGSTGLRLQKSALDQVAPGFVGALPPIGAPDGGTLAGCTYFGSSDAWGRFYDLDVGFPDAPALVARDVKVQVTDNDKDAPDRPSWTTPAGKSHRCEPGHATSNGTLGIGAQASDCREPCTMLPAKPKYFRCQGQSCTPLTGNVPERFRVHNPVLSFARVDGKGFYNGIAIDFPAPASEGLDTLPGTLSFGFGVDPGHTTAAVVLLPSTGYFTTYALSPGADKSTAFVYGASYFDTGTQYLTFEPGNTNIPKCSDNDTRYCPSSQAKVNLWLVSASRSGADPGSPAASGGTASPVIVNVGKWNGPSSRGYGALTDAAEVAPSTKDDPSSRSFVLGAPFFVNRRVHVLIDGQASTASKALVGPAYAVESH